MAALEIASIVASLLPLLMKGGSAVASYFSKGQGSQGTPQGTPQGPGMKAVDSLGGQQPSLTGQQPSLTEVEGGGKVFQSNQQNPQQQELLSQLIEQLKGLMGQGGEDPIAAQQRKQFDEVSLPSLLNRFRSGGGDLRGSGERDAILRAQTDLEGNLAGRKYNMLQNLFGPALQSQQEQIYYQPEPGIVGEAIKGFAPRFADSLAKIAEANYGVSSSDDLSKLLKLLKG